VPRDVQNLEPPITSRQQTGIFTLFPQLPRELRLMIWEHTWPVPRLMELAVCPPGPDLEAEDWEIEDEDVERRYTILRPACSLSKALREDLVSRSVDEEPLEDCPEPVALHVCRESRTHTLTQYTLVCHAYTPAGSFHFSSNRDLLYLSFHYTDDPVYSEALQDNYNNQLDKIEAVLVEDFVWQEVTHTNCTAILLATFKGLKTIHIMFTENDYFDTSDEEDNSDDDTLNGENVQKAASQLRADYAKECLDHPEWTPKKFELMDRSGKIY
jgi:hypothetical protein